MTKRFLDPVIPFDFAKLADWFKEKEDFQATLKAKDVEESESLVLVWENDKSYAVARANDQMKTFLFFIPKKVYNL